jgi:hypothetical protein
MKIIFGRFTLFELQEFKAIKQIKNPIVFPKKSFDITC